MAQPVTPSNSTTDQPPARPTAEEPGRRGPADAPARPAAPAPYPGAPGYGRPGGGGPRKPNRTWIWVVAALVVVGVVLWLFVIPHGGGGQGAGPGAGGGRGGRGGGAGRFGGAPTSVNVAKVVQGEVPIYLEAIGTATPVATVTVRPQIAGQITRIAFQEGQMVRQGQLLIQIDPRQPEQALAQAQGALARDQATLQNARILLQRDQTLLAQDSIARQDVDNQAATVRQLEGTIKVDQAAVGQARLNLSYTRITAPVSGRVGLRQVDVGNYVTVGQQTGTTTATAAQASTGLVLITQVAPIDVLFTVPEDNLPQVNARIHGGASLPVTAFDRAGTTQLAQGKLLTLDNLVDTATGTVRAKARFTNADGSLYPNQFVNVRVLVDTLKGAVIVPTSAVLRGANGLFVYVVDTSTRKVSVRNIQTGPSAGQITAITDGLQVGETVVTDGSDRLREGATVLLPGDCPPAGGFGGPGGRGGRRGQGGGQGGFQRGQGQGGQAGAGGFQRGQGGQGAGQRGGFQRGQGAGACRPGAGGQGGQGGFQRGQGGQGGQGGQSGQGGGLAGAAGGAGFAGGAGAQAPGQGGQGGFAGRQGGGQGGFQRGQGGAQGAPAQGQGQGASAQGAGQGGFQRGQGGGGFGGGRGGPGGGGGGMRLLSELNLTPDQQAKANALMQEARQTAQSTDDPDARRQAMQGAMQRIMPILTPEQRTKLQQLRQQQGGGQGGGGRGGFGGGQG